MNEIKLATVEGKFADIIWSHEPISTSKLVKLCEKDLGWKRTTTYNSFKKAL